MLAGTQYWIMFTWGLAVLGAYYGYGRTLVQIVQPELAARAGWGLICVWGLCVLLFLCGVLLFAGWFGPVAAIAVVSGGLALLALERVRSGSTPEPPSDSGVGQGGLLRVDRAGNISGFIPGMILLVFYAGAVAWMGEVDPNDDPISYFVYPKMMLQTGTFEDLFALRRVTSFGGHSLLQAVTGVVGFERHYHFADCGIARVLLFGLLWGVLSPIRGRAPILFAIAISTFLLTPIPRINTSSELIHAVMLLAVPLTFLATKDSKRPAGDSAEPAQSTSRMGVPGMVLCALVIFGASTFRPHIGFAAALTLTGIVLWRERESQQTFGEGVGVLFAVAAGVVLLLLPWSALLYRSSGTIVFPPFPGNLSSEFVSMHAVQGSLGESIRATLGQLGHLKIIAILLPGILLGFRGPKIGAAVVLASLIVTAMTAYASSDLAFGYFHRYVWPIPFAAMLFTGCGYLKETVRIRQEEERQREVRFRAAVMVVAFGLVMILLLPAGSVYFYRVAGSIGTQMQPPPMPGRARMQQLYQSAQLTMPEGEAALAMADAPYLFDHGRNRILTIDAPGAVSPNGEFPYYQGPEQVREYLLSLGIRFIVFTPPENARLLFRRGYWLHHPRPESFYKRVWAPPMLDLMDNIRDLQLEYPLAFRSKMLQILDLRAKS